MSGSVALRDLMPVAAEIDKRTSLMPEHEILSEVECLSGRVRLQVEYDPRPSFATECVRLERRAELGIASSCGEDALFLRSEVPLDIDERGQSASGRIDLQAGGRTYPSLSYSAIAPAVIPP